MAETPFLTAEWRNLVIVTYGIDPALLAPLLPTGIVPDLRHDRAFASLVAFDFLETRVKGFRVPFHVNFPEINLRFYVRRLLPDGSYRRGVMFVKELVPKPCIALVARRLYNEPYEAIRMASQIEARAQERFISHHFTYRDRDFHLRFGVREQPFLPHAESSAHFFKEHEWGYGVSAKGELLEYRVTHPHWFVYPTHKRFDLQLDFGYIYGTPWACLNGQIPFNITVAKGSEVAVFSPHLIQPTQA